MTNYINPFEKRTFSARFKAVFAFIKQNFVQVMKFYLLVFAAIAALVSWFETAYPDSSLNNLGSLINFVAFAYFAHYVANQGDVRTVSFKDMLKSVVSALGRVLVASLLPIGLAILFVLVFLVYFFAMILIVGGGFDNVGGAFFVIVLLPFLAFVLYMTPILSIYYIHFYFSCKLKDSYDALEESFRLVKGHWWSTMGFIVLFEFLQLIVLLPVILFLQEKTTFISGWIGNLLIFIVSFFTIHVVALYQYGHLKTLREEQGEEKSKIITAKGVVIAVVILLLSFYGAYKIGSSNSVPSNITETFGNDDTSEEAIGDSLSVNDAERLNPRGVYKQMTIITADGLEKDSPEDMYKISTDSVALTMWVDKGSFRVRRNDEVLYYTGNSLKNNSDTSTKIYDCKEDGFVLKWWNKWIHPYVPHNTWCVEKYKIDEYSTDASKIFPLLMTPQSQDMKNPLIGEWRILGTTDNQNGIEEQARGMQTNNSIVDKNSQVVVFSAEYMLVVNLGTSSGRIFDVAYDGNKSIMVADYLRQVEWIDHDLVAIAYKTGKGYEVFERISDGRPVISRIAEKYVK